MNKTERIFKIEQPIAARRLVSFQALRDEVEVSPQRLVFYRESGYLDGWCHPRDGLRSFAVEGIRQAHVLDAPTRDIAAAALTAARRLYRK